MHDNHEKVATQTPNLPLEREKQLREIFPEAWSEGSLDFSKLRTLLGDLNDERPERYRFGWAGKREALRLLQTPSHATFHPAPDESVNFDATQNLFIEGDNLEALKLLYKPLFNRVKMIYIDPPYNTGNDFIYPDNFADPLKNYLIQTGQKDPNGDLQTSTPDTAGHIHSRWLSMLYPRLTLARSLLRDNGLIFVSIDDNEVHHLRLLMNEVFGEYNFVSQLVWQKKTGAGAKSKGFIGLHEHILCYSKNMGEGWDIYTALSEKTRQMYSKKDEHFQKLGPYATWPLDTTSMDERPNLRFPISHDGQEIWPRKQWLWSKERVEVAYHENKLVFNFNEKNNSWSVRFKGYLYDEDGLEKLGKPTSVFIGPFTQEGTKDFEKFFHRDDFPFPKPVNLVKSLLSINVKGDIDEGEIFLDFFSGSGTTAQAVLELNREDGGNRRFVLVQLPEKTGNAQFPTIADIGKERIRRVIARLKQPNGTLDLSPRETPEDLGFKVWKLGESNFRQMQPTEPGDSAAYIHQLELMNDALLPDCNPTSVLYEVALREGFSLNCAIEPVTDLQCVNVWRISDAEKNQHFFVSLDDSLELETLRPLKLSADDLFICRGIALDDDTAANLALQCRLKMI